MINFTAINLDGCPVVQPDDMGGVSTCRVSEELPVYRGPYVNMSYANGLLPFTGIVKCSHAFIPGQAWELGQYDI